MTGSIFGFEGREAVNLRNYYVGHPSFKRDIKFLYPIIYIKMDPSVDDYALLPSPVNSQTPDIPNSAKPIASS